MSEVRPELAAERARVFELLLKKKGLRAARPGTIPRREGSGPGVLSFQQERLWFFNRLDPESPAHNMPVALRLTGRLRVAALQRTLSEVVRRHESLRTTFQVLNGSPAQIVSPPPAWLLAQVDLRHLPESRCAQEARRLAREEAQRTFDLARDPQLRGLLLVLAAGEHVVLLTTHHIASDGWSTGVLVRELGAIYEAFSQQRPSPLPELEIQYADYAQWQRSRLSDGALQADLAYWRGQLEGLPPQLELPADRPRLARQTPRGGVHVAGIPARLLESLLALARSRDSTLFMLLLTALAALLHHHTGQDDMAVGSPVAGRRHRQTEDMIGFFADWLVMRVRLSGRPTFSQLLDRVRALTLDAYAHQDLPVQKVMEELAPERDPSRSPMFQVSLNLLSASGLRIEGLRLPGLEIAPVELGETTANLDLSLYVLEGFGETTLRWVYKADLFDATHVARWAGHFENLLRAGLEEPERRITDLPLLGVAERAQLLVEWNDTARRPAPMGGGCLHELFAAAAGRSPEAVAVICGEAAIGYGDLDRRADRLASFLRRRGVGAEVRVALCCERSIDMVAAVLGVLKAGGAYVPLDPELPPARLAYILEDSGAALVLTQESLRHRLDGFPRDVICLDSSAAFDEEEGPSAAPPAEVSPDNLAYVVYTSGSTGRPKGVLGTHRGAVSYLRYLLSTYELGPADRVLQLASLAFDASVRDLLGPLAAGAVVVLAEPRQARDPRALLSLIAGHRITRLLSAVPTLLRALLDAAEPAGLAPGGTLRTLLLSGERLYLADCARAREIFGDGLEVVNQYGPTEGTMTSSYHRVQLPASGREEALIGRPIPERRFHILRDGRVVPLGAVGELSIAGEGLARGYLGQPGLTASTFRPDPFSASPGGRLYATGDLVYQLPDGTCEFLGRADHQVKLRGFRVELAEIERELCRHPGARQAAVLLREDKPGDPRLVAYVVPAGEPSASGELREHLEQALPDYMVPAAFVTLEALPLNPNGKVDRQALPAPDRVVMEASGESVAPRNDIERELVRIWQEVLGIEPIGVRDSFFKLGGHSLLAVLMMAQVQQRFGCDLPLDGLFRGDTIEDLARDLQTAGLEEDLDSPLVPLRPDGSRPPFFGVHPAGGTVICYNLLAGYLSAEQPFYALKSRGLTTGHEPYLRIEDMARYYVQAVRQIQPRGPYHLGGWSFGGLVAFEMALQIEAAGEEIALLALLDTHAPGRRADREMNDSRTLALFGREVGLSLDEEELEELGPDGMLTRVADAAIEAGILPRESGLLSLRRFLRVYNANVDASQEYLPARPLAAGRVGLLSAGEALGEEAARLSLLDPSRGWSRYTAAPIDVRPVPGSHLSMVREPHVKSLAQVLEHALSGAVSGS